MSTSPTTRLPQAQAGRLACPGEEAQKPATQWNQPGVIQSQIPRGPRHHPDQVWIRLRNKCTSESRTERIDCGGQGKGVLEQGWNVRSALADASSETQDGYTTRPYYRAQGALYPVINHNGKDYENVCRYIAKSLCCTAVINTTLYLLSK